MIGKQSYVQNLMNQCQLLSKNQQKQSQAILFNKIDQIYNIFFENIKESLAQYSNELIVKFMELTCEIMVKRHYAVEMTAHYFQKYKSFNQFYIRALLVKATLIAQQGHLSNKKGEDMINVLKDALSYTTKALDIITGSAGGNNQKGKDPKGAQDNSKQKYSFLIFNVSTCIYKIIRFMLKTNWQKNFTEIVERICKLFDEIDETNHDWRCRYNLILHQCLYDSDKKPDSYKILDQLWEKTKAKPCDFQDELFKLRVHLSKQNGALVASIKKDLEGSGDAKGWKILEVLQRIKSGLIPEPQIQKQLMNAVNSISSAVLIGNESSANKLSPLIQDRLAETGRVALLYGHINIADSITNFLNKVRQLNQKAMILNEYNKAELLIQKKGPQIDNKTGMKLNTAQLKLQEIERRSEALKILQKVCLINKRQNNAELIYQGCILIWNISLPLMTLSQRDTFTKSFQLASQLLEQIDSNDHLKRIQFHLELSKSYFNNQSNFSKVQQHILKAMKLDSTIPRNKITYKYNEEQDLSLYQRPYSKYIEIIHEKSNLKKHHQERMNDDLDKIIIDLWNVVGQKSENTKIDILQKSLGNLVNIEPKEYDYQDAKRRLLVDEEIKEELVLLKQNNLRIHKKKKLLAAEIAELAFEWEINELAQSACEIVIQDKWQPENALEMILSQVKCYYFLGQIYIDHMIKDNLEIAFTEPLKIDPQNIKQELTEANKEQILKRKQKIFKYFSKGIELANVIKQSWLIFNGAIYIWNNFLHIFKNPINDSKLISNLSDLIKQLFETMKNNLKDNNKKIVSYDSDIKGQIFANIGLIYARQMENMKQFDQVNKICQALSLTQLSPHTRKLINSIKSRVTVNKGGNVSTQKQTTNKGKEIVNNGQSGNDVFLFQIVSQIEIIKNSVNRSQTIGLIKKCYESLENWKPRENDETDLELHAELWTRLARLALNQNTTEMFKYSIKCVENSLLPSVKTSNDISSNRLRWYSLAEYTYGESLFKMINLETQDIQVYQKLLFEALNHTIEAVEKGFKCSINILVLDASKQVWNICSRLQQSALNRKNLIKPIYHCLTCLKLLKQKSQVDLLLLLSQLLFKSALQNKQYKIGQTTADMLFQLIPKNMQKSLWQAKMIFMSKQGKNELQAISNMKQVDVSLQSKLWIKLARSSTIINKQYAAYNKSIQILRKQGSVEIVEVLIEYSQWQLRVNKQSHEVIMNNLLLAADYLIDIEYGQDEMEDNLQDDKVTIFSRSSRGRKSQVSNQQSFKSKQTNNKKQLEKKAVISNKSKGSRMNRTAKIANTIKSKNTKSIFVQREEESNPESLNCSHYQKLFRIHTLLALISKTTEERIKYSLDAKHFLIKILQISFRTLNVMDENAAKYTNAMQQKKVNQQYIKKYKIPIQLEDWIKLSLPKQFIQKVKTLQDYNFMGIYMFEKPQLTFNYIQELLNIFQRYGYLLHTVPIFFFMKFISKEIIGNTELHQMCDMKLVRILKRCGFGKQLYEPLEITKFKLNDAQKKAVMNKTNSLKYQPNESVSIDTLYEVPNQIPLPNLIKPFNERQYQIWTNIALELFDIGEVNSSKQLLKQALVHCKILKDIKTMDKCYLGLMKIAVIEGEMVEALNLVMICNKMCRDIKSWETVYEEMFNILLAVRRFDELKKFGESIYNIISKIIDDIKKHKKIENNISHQHQYLELQHFLSTCVLLNVKLAIEEYLLTKSEEKNGTTILQAINSIYGEIINESNMLLFDQYEIVQKTFSVILNGLEEGLIESHNSQFGISMNNKIINILLKLETQIMNSGKYCLIGISEQCFKKHNPMIKLQYKIRICIGRSYNIEGLLKKAGNVEEIRKKMERISLLQQDKNTQEQPVKKQPENKMFQPLKKYLQTLTIKIQKDIAPIEKRLDSYQASISLLRNLENKIQQGVPEEIELGMLLMSAERKRAALKQELSQIWAQVPNYQDHADKFDANQSLQRSQDFIEKYQNRCGDVLQQPTAFSICRRIYVEMIQNRGRIFSEKTFQYLVKYQHYGYLEKLKKCFGNWLEDNNSLISFERLLRKIPVFNKSIVDQINKVSLFQSLTKFPSYTECINLIPNNSALILLSLSLNKNQIYFAMYSKVNSLEAGKQPIITYNVRKMQLNPKIKVEIYELQKQFSSIKSTLSKIPINQEQKYSYLVEELQLRCKKAMDRFEQLQLWWSEQVKAIVNTPRPEPSIVVDPKDAKKQTKQAPKNVKKGGKDELSSYQSPLIPSPSGIESLTLLIDSELFNFPFQHLSCFSSVPSLSRDTSLLFLSRKLQSLNYKPQLNNSDNFGIDKAKYVCYDYKTQEQNGQSTFLQLSKISPSIKFQGISTTKRLPSLGEYQQIFSTSNILHVYGSLSYVNTLKFQPLVSNIPTSKLRLIVINDNINAEKSILNKFYPIENGEIHLIEEEDIDTIHIMNLMNISVVKTRWSVNVDDNKNMIKELYKEGSGNIYLAAAVKKVLGTKESELGKIGMFINGPATVRL